VIVRDDVPETPDWSPDSRACPLPQCDVCSPPKPRGFGVYPVPENIELGSE